MVMILLVRQLLVLQMANNISLEFLQLMQLELEMHLVLHLKQHWVHLLLLLD